MNIDTRNTIISVVLGIVIIILTYVLYDAIVTPYERVQQKKEVTQQVRQRMINVRDALIQYQFTKKEFPAHLDSLVTFLRTDENLSTKLDSLFQERPPLKFNLDSLIFSPRTGKQFIYARIDSIRPNIYFLGDPDTKDAIGDSSKTTLLNAATWE